MIDFTILEVTYHAMSFFLHESACNHKFQRKYEMSEEGAVVEKRGNCSLNYELLPHRPLGVKVFTFCPMLPQ